MFEARSSDGKPTNDTATEKAVERSTTPSVLATGNSLPHLQSKVTDSILSFAIIKNIANLEHEKIQFRYCNINIFRAIERWSPPHLIMKKLDSKGDNKILDKNI